MFTLYDYHKIKEIREDNDKTQKEVSEKTYVSKKTYERYEKGERIPPIDFMIRLADYYNCSLDYLCGRKKKRTDLISPFFSS